MSSTMHRNDIENICAILGDCVTGLKITNMLTELRMFDMDNGLPPYTTKRIRLANAVINESNQTQKPVQALRKIIEYICKPGYLIANDYDWPTLQLELNRQLQFLGLKVNDKGLLEASKKTETYDEGQKRYNSLMNKLENLDIHPKVLRLCKPEILDKNYFHLTFEASKVIFESLRTLSGYNEDGNELVKKCFISSKDTPPKVVLNKLESQTEKSEQDGLRALLFTIGSLFRNTKAHELKAYSPSSESDAIAALIMISLALNMLEKCQFIG